MYPAYWPFACQSVVNAALLHPLPIPDAQRVVLLHLQLPAVNLPRTQVSALQYRDFSAHTDLFEIAAAYSGASFNLTGGDQPKRLNALRVSASLLPLLGIQPVLGRPFRASDDTYGNQHVILLSQSLWEGLFGLRMLLNEGVRVLLAGNVMGAIASFGLTRFLVSVLYEVKPQDPVTLIAVALLLSAAALLACYIPARRAMRSDPLTCLRYE